MSARKVYEDAPAVELAGLNFLVYCDALGVHRRAVRQTLERAGIGEPRADRWYRRQIILDVLRTIDQQGDLSTLFRVGKELATFTHPGSGVTSLEQKLERSSLTYAEQQRNRPTHDFIRVERDGAAWRYRYHTPWPSQLIRGYLWQLLGRFYPGRLLQIELIEGTEDDYERTFRLSWHP